MAHTQAASAANDKPDRAFYSPEPSNLTHKRNRAAQFCCDVHTGYVLLGRCAFARADEVIE
jgi:hypothetical protein